MPIITEIDDKYVDYDFQTDPAFVFGDLGNPLFGSPFESYEDRYGTLSDSEIQAEIERTEAEGLGQENVITRVYNQKNEGSCVANAYGAGHELCQAIQVGTENVIPLSAISLYDRIGRSAQSGAMVSDGWDELVRGGIGPLDTPKNRERFGNRVKSNTGFRTAYPTGYKELMLEFVGVEATIIRSLQGLKSAGVTPGGIIVGREGHSILYVRIRTKSGRFVFMYVNSWDRWGQPAGNMEYGFGHDTLSQIQKSASYAVKIRAVKCPQLVTAL